MKTKLALGLVLVAMVVALVACGGANAADPKSVAEGFLNALKNMDFVKAQEFATDEAKTILQTFSAFTSNVSEEDKKKSAEQTVTIGKVEENGDAATVTYTMSGEGAGEQKLDLKKVDGKWKVDFKKES